MLTAMPKMTKNLKPLVIAEFTGLSPCGNTWGSIIASYVIYDTLRCTEGNGLNQQEYDCLVGKLGEIIKTNCC